MCYNFVTIEKWRIILRILHTADWHLGCKTDDLDRLEEQKAALKQLTNIAKTMEVDMVIIAGDIYDSLIPSSDAEDLFYRTVSDLNNNGNTIVLAIAGNHDEPKRLCNANIFANKFGIFMIGTNNKIAIPKPDFSKAIYPIESGKGYIKFKKQNGEEAVVAYLPYPSYYRYKESKKENENFSDKVSEWLAPGISAFKDNTVNILTAHIMAYGAEQTDEEREAYDTISSVKHCIAKEVLYTPAHYTALGHIHKCIPLNRERNIFYSGSLINQFFDNSEPTKIIVADIDANNGVTNLEKIPLDVKCLEKHEVTSMLHAEVVCKDNPDKLLKIVVQNVDRVRMEEIKHLRTNYKNLVTLSVLTKEAMETTDIVSKRDLTNSEIFDHFVKARLGTEPDSDVKELFLSLMSEGLYEAD